uniref:Uncharacterized protein n=1 Tax=Siphoviridae sp. ct2vX3 TaxID=2825318 RepID=A0A8S5PY25_9CAUD|nr:MAG TPA: hypothetical protein [Siphoviridae sp. ct2vX3]
MIKQKSILKVFLFLLTVERLGRMLSAARVFQLSILLLEI